MKEAIVKKDLSVDVVDVERPKPGPDEVLIKVIVAGMNPKDWKLPNQHGLESNTGDDIAGLIEEVGENVFEFHEGDRVAAYHKIMTPNGAFAEYAIAPYWTTFHIPKSVSFEEAATVPLAAYTSVCALFHELEVPEPWSPMARAAEKKDSRRPLIIYGASTATGSFAIKLAAAADIHPIIAVGSQTSSFIKPFLNKDKGDQLIDYTLYKSGDELVKSIQEAVKKGGAPDGRCWKAFDSVSEDHTVALLTKAIAGPADASGIRPRVANLLFKTEPAGRDPNVDIVNVSVGLVHEAGEKDKMAGVVWGAAFARGLREGWFTAHPYIVGENGLNGIPHGMIGLKNGIIRGQKYLTRIPDTPGLGN